MKGTPEVSFALRCDCPPARRVHSPGQIGNLVGDAASSLAKLLTIQDDPPSAIKAKKLLGPLDRRIAMWKARRAVGKP